MADVRSPAALASNEHVAKQAAMLQGMLSGGEAGWGQMESQMLKAREQLQKQMAALPEEQRRREEAKKAKWKSQFDQEASSSEMASDTSEVSEVSESETESERSASPQPGASPMRPSPGQRKRPVLGQALPLNAMPPVHLRTSSSAGSFKGSPQRPRSQKLPLVSDSPPALPPSPGVGGEGDTRSREEKLQDKLRTETVSLQKPVMPYNSNKRPQKQQRKEMEQQNAALQHLQSKVLALQSTLEEERETASLWKDMAEKAKTASVESEVKIENLNKQLDQLEETRESLLQQISQLMKQLEAKENVVQKQAQELENLRDRVVADMKRKADSLEAEVSELKQALSSAKTETKELQSQLQSATSTQQLLDAAKANSEADAKRSKELMDTVAAQLQEKSDMVAELRREIVAHKEKTLSVEREKDALRIAHESMQKMVQQQNLAFEVQLASAANRGGDNSNSGASVQAEAELRRLKMELESEQERYTRFSKRADADITELRRKLNDERLASHEQVDKFHNERREAANEKYELQRKLRQAQLEIKTLQEQASRGPATGEEEESTYLANEKRINDLTRECESLRAAKDLAEAKQRQAQQELDQMKLLVDRQTSDTQRMQTDNDSLKSALKMVERSFTSTQAELEALKNQEGFKQHLITEPKEGRQDQKGAGCCSRGCSSEGSCTVM